MRALALAFGLTLTAGAAIAGGCNYGSVSAQTTPSTVTAEAPQQTPVPATVRTGS